MTSAGAANAMSMAVFQAAASPWLKGTLGPAEARRTSPLVVATLGRVVDIYLSSLRVTLDSWRKDVHRVVDVSVLNKWARFANHARPPSRIE